MLPAVRRIIIVGGGAAGWLSAAILNRLRKTRCPELDITVVEPAGMSPIGVGEATTTTTRNVLLWLDINEHDWLKQCDGSFKFGIKFVGWKEKDLAYWHVFENPQKPNGVALPLLWLARFPQRDFRRFSYECFRAPYLCEANRAPRGLGARPFSGKLTYGYHVSVARHIAYMKAHAIAGGVRCVDDRVLDATLGEDGAIRELVTEKGARLSADLFVDCTGFQGLLVNQKLGEPFVSFRDSLLCDRAIALQLPHREPGGDIRPYTTATAMGHGWCWDIPLQTRDGVGYVHAGDFVEPGAAMRELSTLIGRDAEALDPKLIRLRTGYTRRPWVKNCMSIGLANGFIEPLESTGNSLIEVAAVTLHQVLERHRGQPIPDQAIGEANARIRQVYEEVRDFIALHYCTTDRTDTAFWRAVRHEMTIPESVKEKLEYLRAGLPGRDLAAFGLPWFDEFFPQFSYLCVLVGMNHLPRVEIEAPRRVSDEQLEVEFAEVEREGRRLASKLPPLRALLDGLDTSRRFNPHKWIWRLFGIEPFAPPKPAATPPAAEPTRVAPPRRSSSRPVGDHS